MQRGRAKRESVKCNLIFFLEPSRIIRVAIAEVWRPGSFSLFLLLIRQKVQMYSCITPPHPTLRQTSLKEQGRSERGLVHKLLLASPLSARGAATPL